MGKTRRALAAAVLPPTSVAPGRVAHLRSRPSRDAELQVPTTRSSHEHAWQTRSRHPTTEGVVRYQRCHCGSWRALLGTRPAPVVETGGRTTHSGHRGLP
jgi:hypothetical protein